MNENLSFLPTAVTAPLQTDCLTLEANLAQLELDSATCEANFNALLAAADTPTIRSLEEISETYFIAVDEAVAKGNSEPDFLPFIRSSSLPRPIKETYELKVELESQKERIEEDLENYAQDKAMEVLTKATAIEQAINYEELIERGSLLKDFQEQREQVYRVIRARKFYEAGHTPSYRESKFIDQSLDVYSASLCEAGLLFEDPLSIPEISPKVPGLILNAQKLREALILYRMYKKDSLEIDDLAEVMLEDAISTAILFRDDDSSDMTAKDLINKITASYNESFERALTNKLLEKLQGMSLANLETDASSELYEQILEQMQDISLSEALKDITIEMDQKNLPFEIDVEDLLMHLAVLTPRIALRQIKGLSICSFIEEGYTATNEKQELLGFSKFIPRLNGYKIFINTAVLSREFENTLRMYGDSPDKRTIITALLNRGLMEVLFHEVGHVLHRTLPLATLKRWDKRRLSDPINISEYVQHSYGSSHEDGEPEDFCDSLRFFTTEPDKLPLISPSRHIGIEEIYEELMPGYTQVLKPYLEQKVNDYRLLRQQFGLAQTDEERRAAYLAHENSKNNVS